MAIKPKDIYDGRKKKRSWSTIITLSIIGLLALTILLFYGLRARCVYDQEGNATIVFPFTQAAKELKEAQADQPQESGESTPPPLDTAVPGQMAVPGDAAVSPDLATPSDIASPDGTLPADTVAPRGGASPDESTPPAASDAPEQ